MALTPEQIASLTLGELEAIAERFAAAVDTIKTAQSLIAPVTPVVAPPPAPASSGVPRIQLSPAEQATRDALLARQFGKGEVPDSMLAALGSK